MAAGRNLTARYEEVVKVKKTLIALVVVIALIAGSTHWLLTEHNLAMEIYDDQLFPIEARFV